AHLQAENALEVRVRDELHKKILPYGKQCEKRGGMWYTPVSGIWQTVWLESVPARHIQDIRIKTTLDSAKIMVNGITEGEILLDGTRFPLKNGTAEIHIKNPKHWSPETPHLYRFAIEAGKDRVESYFALRTIEAKVVDGIPRLCLNGKPYFFHGLLDQGYWSDGVFTPASPAAYARDILAAKKLGFNTLRKHIKIEPQLFYYECDRLGMAVFQDMVNNSDYNFIRDTALPTIGLKKLPDKFLHPNRASRAAFRTHVGQTVRQLQNHPSILYWTIFNEGWGQFDSQAAYEKLKALDPSRIIDSTSGWFFCGESDVESHHVYFKPYKFRPGKKPVVLSEFGGYVFRPEGHLFNPGKAYGYRFFNSQPELQAAVEKLYREEILPAIPKGLCAAIYTQLTDVEDETNGVLSYDRQVEKLSPEGMLAIAREMQIGG
ncbi:MAG: glycoside hydrolase family 2, partial [Clostridia bacterium]|nr:glycoside hydrolase family 2 [Clostridia bacterium]